MPTKRWWGLLFALLALSQAAWAQDVSTTPISNHDVLCDVTIDGHEMQLKIVNGGLGRVKLFSTDRTYGLTPVVRNGEVSVVLWEITPAATPPAGRIRQLETVPAPLGETARFTKADVPITVKISGVKELPANAVEEAVAAGTRCCIPCGGIEACASEGQTDCGQCVAKKKDR
jgi:hypothetical protein